MVFNLMRKKTELPSPDEALPGRDMPLNVSGKHFILDTPLVSPWPEGFPRSAAQGKGGGDGNGRGPARRAQAAGGVDPPDHELGRARRRAW